MPKQVFETVVNGNGGLEMNVESRGLTFTLDEPENLGGSNKGMNPVEALLGALGGCIGICIQSFAESQHIHLHNFSIRLEGDLDTDGFLGKNPQAKKGFSEIRTFIELEADNRPEEIREFIKFVENTCPVHDTIMNSPVSKIIVNGEALDS